MRADTVVPNRLPASENANVTVAAAGLPPNTLSSIDCRASASAVASSHGDSDR